MEDTCYYLKELNYPEGFLDESVDATFIITMENYVERHKNIAHQLRKFHPTRKIIIVYNKGFKTCKKYSRDERVDTPYEDLAHANMFIFQNAKSYNNILVLEDDFIFCDEILRNHVHDSINNYILKKRPNLYLLGCEPFLATFIGTHMRVFFFGGTHAVVYSRQARLKLLDLYKKSHENQTIKDMDWLTNYITNIYTYYKPLCVQPKGETENKQYWGPNSAKQHPCYHTESHSQVTKLIGWVFICPICKGLGKLIDALKIVPDPGSDNVIKKTNQLYLVCKIYHVGLLVVILMAFTFFVKWIRTFPLHRGTKS